MGRSFLPGKASLCEQGWKSLSVSLTKMPIRSSQAAWATLRLPPSAQGTLHPCSLGLIPSQAACASPERRDPAVPPAASRGCCSVEGPGETFPPVRRCHPHALQPGSAGNGPGRCWAACCVCREAARSDRDAGQRLFTSFSLCLQPHILGGSQEGRTSHVPPNPAGAGERVSPAGL